MKFISLSIVSFVFYQIGYSQPDSVTDYSNPRNWAATLADTVYSFEQFRKDSSFAGVDVFYLYPTLLTDDKDTNWNFDIEIPRHRKAVGETLLKYQASAWSELGQVYCPLYRQAHIRSYYNLDNGGKEAIMKAYTDVRAAFLYYLEHYNNGNAIVLAGHSQGSTHLMLLMKEFFDGKPLQEKLIAAYLPGNALKMDEFKHIPFMTKPDQTGGFVSWNTFKKKYNTPYFQKWFKGSVTINPVTWDTTAFASRSKHEGFLFSNGKLYEHSFETNVIDGGVWLTLPHFPYRYLSFKMKTYHAGDVNLFWEDIRQNARLRVLTYLQENSTLNSRE